MIIKDALQYFGGGRMVARDLALNNSRPATAGTLVILPLVHRCRSLGCVYVFARCVGRPSGGVCKGCGTGGGAAWGLARLGRMAWPLPYVVCTPAGDLVPHVPVVVVCLLATCVLQERVQPVLQPRRLGGPGSHAVAGGVRAAGGQAAARMVRARAPLCCSVCGRGGRIRCRMTVGARRLLVRIGWRRRGHRISKVIICS